MTNITYRLTAKKSGSARCPLLMIEYGMWVGNVFGCVCLSVSMSVCLSCSGSNCWKPWLSNLIFWYTDTFSEPQGQHWVSRSWSKSCDVFIQGNHWDTEPWTQTERPYFRLNLLLSSMLRAPVNTHWWVVNLGLKGQLVLDILWLN